MIVLEREKVAASQPHDAQIASMIAYLRRSMYTGVDQRERFHAIFLDRNHSYLSDVGLGLGGPRGLSFRMRDLFSKALAAGAHNIIVAHNHPSGDCRPSEKDIVATRRLTDIATALDIRLVDHLIITHSSVYSMRAGGIL